MGEEELNNLHFEEGMEFDLIEESATEVTDDGVVVTEQVTALVDPYTGEAVIDSIVEIETPEGAKVHEETLSVVDAEGHVEIIAEEADAAEE